MSETTTEDAPELVADAPVPDPAVTAAPDALAPTPDPSAIPEAPDLSPDLTQPPPKPKQGDRRFAILSAKAQADRDRADAAERELAATRALLQAAKPETTPAPAPPPPAAAAIERAAQTLVAQREFERSRQAVIAAGTKEMGEAAWNEKTTILRDLGATDNQAFMQALVEIPGAHKLVAKFADDADGLMALLAKSPVAMAAEMGRMAAQIERPAARSLSSAPRPATPVSTPAVVPEPDPLDDAQWEGKPMGEWVAAWDKRQAQRRAAGRRT